jgi:hypothetical protein
MKSVTFSAVTMKFSPAEMGILGEFVLILFYSYEKNPKRTATTHHPALTDQTATQTM